jgi:hypothetical protein
MKKMQQSPRDMWDTIKPTNIQKVKDPKVETEKNPGKRTTKKLPKFYDVNLHIQAVQ